MPRKTTVTEENSITVDFARENASQLILPGIPLLSTHGLGWNGMQIESHQLAAHETPQHQMAQHVIVIHHLLPAKIERQLGDSFQQEHIACDRVVVIPANVPHKSHWQEEVKFTLLLLEPTFVAHTAHEYIDPSQVEILPRFAISDPLICQIVSSLRSEFESCGWVSRLYAESAASLLAVHLLQKHSTHRCKKSIYRGGLSNSALRQVTDYIEAHLNQNLGLAELANLVQTSINHFGRQFKQSTGKTPHQYLIERRLERAKDLLIRTNASIDEIAEHTGFYSHSHLTKIFRRYLSITPNKYRQIS